MRKTVRFEKEPYGTSVNKKKLVIEMKIALDKLSSKLKLKRISYLKYMTEKITHNPTQSCKEMENRKESLRPRTCTDSEMV